MDCLVGMKLMKDNSVDLVVTDPPYEVDYDKKSQELEKFGKARQKQIDRDKSFKDELPDLNVFTKELYRILKDNSHCYIFCGDKLIPKWTKFMFDVGFKYPQILVWKKDITTFDMTMGYKFPENKEFILFFQKGWKKLNGYKIERQQFRSCLTFKSEGSTKYHSCAKPFHLINFLIKLSSKEKDVILDSFMGSGTTALCSKGLNRNFIGFEISKEYYDIINKRLKQENLRDWFVKD